MINILLAKIAAKAAIKVSKKALIIGAGAVGGTVAVGGTAGLIIHHHSKKETEALLADESLAEDKGAERVEAEVVVDNKAEAAVVETPVDDKKAEQPKPEETTIVAEQKEEAKIIDIAPLVAPTVSPEQFNKQVELNTSNETPASDEVKSEIPAIPAHQDMGNNSYQLPWQRPDYFQPNPVYEFVAQNGIKLPEQVVQKIEENAQNNTEVPQQMPNYFGVGAPTGFYAGPVVKAPMSQFNPNVKKEQIELNNESETPKVVDTVTEQPLEVKEVVEQKEEINTPKKKVNTKKKSTSKKKK